MLIYFIFFFALFWTIYNFYLCVFQLTSFLPSEVFSLLSTPPSEIFMTDNELFISGSFIGLFFMPSSLYLSLHLKSEHIFNIYHDFYSLCSLIPLSLSFLGHFILINFLPHLRFIFSCSWHI